MRVGYQSLGWWMRRPTGFADGSLNGFYTEIVGLPLLRRGGLASLFWAGEDLVFEIKVGDEPSVSATDVATAALLPIFRSHDLSVTLARFAAAGYEPEVTEESAYATTVWIRGEDGLLLGFEERSSESPFAADKEALRRWELGPPHLPGADVALAPELQYLSRARRRVEDLERASAIYGGLAGLDRVGEEGEAVVFSLGDTVLLELRPNGTSRAAPADRSELPDSFISRIHGFEQYVDGLTNAGATWIGEQIRYETGSNLAYFSDPEGMVLGIESRSSWGDYPDDIEAERRWSVRAS